eukprot:GHUV01026390.1.p1 GENE.GHUV01026390.1~~GHUV01026390.1.p1  ORF type:complete len:128 (+),score=20.25 GHUV01026390.1:847-1230(+)
MSVTNWGLRQQPSSAAPSCSLSSGTWQQQHSCGHSAKRVSQVSSIGRLSPNLARTTSHGHDSRCGKAAGAGQSIRQGSRCHRRLNKHHNNVDNSQPGDAAMLAFTLVAWRHIKLSQCLLYVAIGYGL